ncbi:hypothetical protein LY90DRAFT_510787 [Neocallimastix californiae]|uniref:Uncharacterized protein n=1 Tax=Neocallimastix californiae TaxID=1754190 RepID=A0A1Y2BY25_9FUNG|nr:hypothetical protein LY90DRAFT_510787 [Neocallimastix californiae]|eukprot:ORY38965.1 hypothetical protein LY90DRAFT_510787 [Neocallimastix californiae]
MRFTMYNIILPLLSSTAVLGSILGSTLGADGLFQSITSYGGSEACINEIKLVENCIMSDITKNNLADSCSNYNSPTCQDFFNDPMKIVPSCNENSIVSTFINSSIGLISLDLKVKCQNDENNNSCPLAELELTNNNAGNDQILEAVKNSCKSKICRENTLNFLENVSETNAKASDLLQSSLSKISGSISEESLNSIIQDQTNNGNEFSSYLEILKSDNCQTRSLTDLSTNDAIPTINHIFGIINTYYILIYII